MDRSKAWVPQSDDEYALWDFAICNGLPVARETGVPLLLTGFRPFDFQLHEVVKSLGA